MPDKPNLQLLSLEDIAERCTNETNSYFQHKGFDSSYCLELFRRAIVERDQKAWEYIVIQYEPLVTRWVQQHYGVSSTGEDVEYFVNRAFEKLASTITADRFNTFSDLGNLLRYLKMCVHSVIIDYKRTGDYTALSDLDEASDEKSEEPSPEEQAIDHSIRQMLREQVQNALTSLSDREREVLELRFGLKDGKDHTLEEVSSYFEVTREHIRQIEAMALRKLRHPSRNRQDDAYVYSPVTEPDKNHSQADEVTFTSYNPEEGSINEWHTLLVYAHLLADLERVRENAKRTLEANRNRFYAEAMTSRPTRIVRGTPIHFWVSCQGVTFVPNNFVIRWTGNVARADFSFKADESLIGTEVEGRISICIGPLIIGTLKFSIRLNDKKLSSVSNHEEQSKMYGKDDIFISYSRKDTDVARAFKKILAATGFDVFLDVDDVRTGQLWEDELMRRIERAKIFQIFWSQNYSESENCRAEWEYALKQNKEEGYIRPVFWKEPLSPKPPDELNKFNFKYVELDLPSK